LKNNLAFQSSNIKKSVINHAKNKINSGEFCSLPLMLTKHHDKKCIDMLKNIIGKISLQVLTHYTNTSSFPKQCRQWSMTSGNVMLNEWFFSLWHQWHDYEITLPTFPHCLLIYWWFHRLAWPLPKFINTWGAVNTLEKLRKRLFSDCKWLYEYEINWYNWPENPKFFHKSILYQAVQLLSSDQNQNVHGTSDLVHYRW